MMNTLNRLNQARHCTSTSRPHHSLRLLAGIGALALIGLSSMAQAKTETFTLKSAVGYGEEAMVIETTKGSVTLNINTLPEAVINSLHKYNLKKGACISVNSSRGLLAEDGNGAGIQSITNCKAGSTGTIKTQPVPSNNTTAQSSSRFRIYQGSGKVLLGRCYMEMCTWSKTVATQVVKDSGNEVILKVTLLGGESDNTRAAMKRIKWNDGSHNIGITCSYTRPSVSVGNQTDVLPLNSNGVPGVLESSAGLYFNYCHSYTGGVDNGIRKFGYNVPEQNW